MSNKRLNKTIQKALKHNSRSVCVGGRCLWLDAYNNAVFDEFAPTIRTTIQTSCMNFIMEKEETNKEPKICAMRGRSDGEWHESEHEQRIECREDGVTNTITGVSKDCLVFKEMGVLERHHQQDFVQHEDGISRALCAGCHGSASHLTKTMVSSNLGFRVRRLTERELFRLMDVSEEDIDKIQAAGISKTQQAKMAGNSICVNVLYHIFRKMFVDSERETAQLELF